MRRKPPKRVRPQISVSLDPTVAANLRRYCDTVGVTQSELLDFLLAPTLADMVAMLDLVESGGTTAEVRGRVLAALDLQLAQLRGEVHAATPT